MRIGAAILVGGTSRRMGSPKQHVPLPSGESLGEGMVRLARTVADIVIGAGPAGALDGIEMVGDLETHQGMGPLAGVEAALASARADRWLILPCDMPWLGCELLRSMIDHPTKGCVTLQGAGPLPLRIDIDELESVSAALDRGSLAVRELPCVCAAVEVPVRDPACLHDVDRPEDLQDRSRRPRP